MYEVLNKDAMKYEILPHLSVEKRGYVSKGNLTEVIQRILYKPGNWLSLADYFCVCMMLLSLSVGSMPHKCSPWPSHAYMFFVPLPTRAYLLQISFVSFSARNLTL